MVSNLRFAVFLDNVRLRAQDAFISQFLNPRLSNIEDDAFECE